MSFVDMNQTTGGRIEGLEQLKQSVATILKTPIGSRVMRRDFGSELPALLDKDLTPSVMMRFKAATISALTKWEPRLQVTRVHADAIADEGLPHRVSIGIEGVYLPDGRPVTLEGIQL